MGFSWIMLGREPRSNKEPLMTGSTESYSLGVAAMRPRWLKGENQAYKQLSTHGTVIFTSSLSGSCTVSAI
jgi:hypothetical protein